MPESQSASDGLSAGGSDPFALPDPAPDVPSAGFEDDFGSPPSPTASAEDAFAMPDAAVPAPAPSSFPADDFSPAVAYAPPPASTDAFELPAASQDKAEAFMAQWELQLNEKAAAESAAKQALKEDAEVWLDKFHDETTDRKLAKMQVNRSAQDEQTRENDRLLEEARRDSVSRWNRVYDLIETTPGVASPTDRMLKLLINLKVKGN